MTMSVRRHTTPNLITIEVKDGMKTMIDECKNCVYDNCHDNISCVDCPCYMDSEDTGPYACHCVNRSNGFDNDEHCKYKKEQHKNED